MKKILILAYDFPPYVSVGGLRPYSWYKYFKECGLEPIVITRQWENRYGDGRDYIAPSRSKDIIVERTEFGTIIKTPYYLNIANKIQLKYGKEKLKFIRKIISGYYEAIQWMFYVGLKKNIYIAAKKYLKNNHIDLIIATGEPFILFKYAYKLSKIYYIPWIADYRDPWSQNKLRSKNYFLKKWYSYFERKYLQNVNTITTVSSFFENQINQLIKHKSYHIIPNGYDSDAITQAKGISQKNNILSIAFVGTIYKWHPIDVFLSTCSQYVSDHDNAKLHLNFYGINIEKEIKDKIDKIYKDLKPYVNIYSRIPNDELLKKLAVNNIFLLFNYYSYTGTKVYDYLALKRKILLCFSDDEEANILKNKYYNVKETKGSNNHLQEDLIRETNSGIIVKDSNHLYNLLEELYAELEANGSIECNTKNFEQYSRKIQTKRLAELIKTVIKGYHSECLLCGSKQLNKMKGYQIDYLVKCEHCGFVFSSKIPAEKEILEHYEGYGRNDYLSPVTIKRYNELLDVFEKYRRTNKILDVGSGIGYFLDEAKKRGWEVYGTEITDKAIEICQQKGIKMYKGKLADVGLDENAFDVVTSFEVIEHINNPRQELEIIYKLLRKGGVFYFTTPNFNAVERFLLGSRYSIIYYPEHLSYYTSKTIDALMRRFDLKKIRLKTTGISLSRLQSHEKIPPHTQIITQTADDEKIRSRIEKNFVLKVLTKVMNIFLNLFKIGNSIKGLYQKK